MSKPELENYEAKPIPSREEIKAAVLTLIAACYGRGYNTGWWHDPETGKDIRETRNTGELLCLVHSEVSEAMEGHRKNLPDDKLPLFRMFVVELCDALIRIFDMAGAKCDPETFAEAFVLKGEYNEHRPDHKHENRTKEGGKAY